MISQLSVTWTTSKSSTCWPHPRQQQTNETQCWLL